MNRKRKLKGLKNEDGIVEDVLEERQEKIRCETLKLAENDATFSHMLMDISQDDNNSLNHADFQSQMDFIDVKRFSNISAYEDVHGKPGHLQSIRLLNFMCHENFYFEFSPRVNVIHGQNGSKFCFFCLYL